MKTVVALVLFFCSVGICQTTENQVTLDYETTGNEFLRLCSVADSGDFTQLNESLLNDLVSCVYYVRGFTDGVSIERLFVKSKAKRNAPAPFCIPEELMQHDRKLACGYAGRASGNRRGGHGQLDTKSCPFAGCAVNRDRAAMLRYDPLGDGES